MKLLKDLLYTRDNASLDISRLSSLLSVVAFWGGVFWLLATKGEFDPVQTGTGCAAIFAGAAGWIHFRQKHEGPRP
ncbi:hypothetical protein [Novosphingobium decolorationis]|uniref:Uncharacterized protein n=1 Tax=Novosphingobium decolorationis TaxID=2698673 RepID=A0ABX8E4D8_9SPHN|nr:hypothetical protein [Novosphingobium decolorationis]QVM82926.1 hypothetical protein HT578_03695 [Novosphingobium decolorationis]